MDPIAKAVILAALAIALAAPASPDTETSIALSDAIATAPAGSANGHLFAHLVDLDANIVYTGGATITEDVCIRGNSARLDLEGSFIGIVAVANHTRFDIEYCLIVDGSHPGGDSYGGGIVYGSMTQGWVANNTFYNNSPCGVYLHEVVGADDSTRIVNNIFFRNVLFGLIRNDEQPGLYIRYNDGFGNSMGQYAEHCGCPSGPPEPIGAEDLHSSNLTVDPKFVRNPSPPKVEGDFHLLVGSPCIGSGQDGSDMGALPGGVAPAVLRGTWGSVKAHFR
jgi:hypothetical protein